MLRLDWQREIYRASRLDLFREYLSGETWNGDEFTPVEFVRRMTEPEETEAMAAGTALHAVLESAGFGSLPSEVKQDGWKIIFDLDADVQLPPMREIGLFRQYGAIRLHGRVDAMDATTVHDIKTTKAIDADHYADSFQWRAYLWMSGRTRFVYDIFRVIRDEKAREMVVKEYVAIPLAAYPGLPADVESLLVEFDAAVKALGIPEIMAKKRREAMNDPANLLAAG